MLLGSSSPKGPPATPSAPTDKKGIMPLHSMQMVVRGGSPSLHTTVDVRSCGHVDLSQDPPQRVAIVIGQLRVDYGVPSKHKVRVRGQSSLETRRGESRGGKEKGR